MPDGFVAPSAQGGAPCTEVREVRYASSRRPCRTDITATCDGAPARRSAVYAHVAWRPPPQRVDAGLSSGAMKPSLSMHSVRSTASAAGAAPAPPSADMAWQPSLGAKERRLVPP